MADFGRAFGNALGIFFTGLGSTLAERQAQEQEEQRRRDEAAALINQETAALTEPMDVAPIRAAIGELETPTESFIGAFAGREGLEEGALPNLSEAQRMNISRGLQARENLRTTAARRGIRTDTAKFVAEERNRERLNLIRNERDRLIEAGLNAEDATTQARNIVGGSGNEILGFVTDPETGEFTDALAAEVQPIVDARQQAAAFERFQFIVEQTDKIADDVEKSAAVQDLNTRMTKLRDLIAILEDPSSIGSAAALQAFQKMIDPDSVVRESEIDLILRNFGGIERVRAWINQIGAGGIANQAAIASRMRRIGRQIVAGQAQLTLPQIQTFINRANRVGAPLDAIFPATMLDPSGLRNLIVTGEDALTAEDLAPGLVDAFDAFERSLLPDARDPDGNVKASGINVHDGGG